MHKARYILVLVGLSLLAGNVPPPAPTGSVTGKVEAIKGGKPSKLDDTWVYLEDLARRPDSRPGRATTETMTQKSIQFAPRVVVVPVGATIAFPNKDPIEHNVFSPPASDEDKKNYFDLQRYGPTVKGKTWKFLEPGEFKIYCDIHKDMSAIVKVVPTRFYAKVAPDGTFTIRDVPPGRYKVSAWAPASTPVKTDAFEITTGQSVAAHTLHLQLGDPPKTHLNKNGDPYPLYDK